MFNEDSCPAAVRITKGKTMGTGEVIPVYPNLQPSYIHAILLNIS